MLPGQQGSRRRGAMNAVIPMSDNEMKGSGRAEHKTLRVLLAESTPSDLATTLRDVLASGDSAMELTAVSSLSTLLPTIPLVNPDLLFLDLAISRPAQVEAVRQLRRVAPGIPLIVLAEPAEKSLATKCLAEGAMDYLLKG